MINGNELIDLLIQYQVGVKQEECIISSIDTEYWNEVIGVSVIQPINPGTPRVRLPRVKFPLAIEARHRGQTYLGELLDLSGKVRFDGQEYATPTGAAKAIATSWREVNGWKFWKYQDLDSGDWEYIRAYP